jgi:hypothetical protein
LLNPSVTPTLLLESPSQAVQRRNVVRRSLSTQLFAATLKLIPAGMSLQSTFRTFDFQRPVHQPDGAPPGKQSAFLLFATYVYFDF